MYNSFDTGALTIVSGIIAGILKAFSVKPVKGVTKLSAKIYVQILNECLALNHNKGHTKFITTRFWNVLDSNGFVVPIFKKQLANGGPLTVTHPDITRYFMTIPEACQSWYWKQGSWEMEEKFMYSTWAVR